jgi:hypothetical protein
LRSPIHEPVRVPIDAEDTQPIPRLALLVFPGAVVDVPRDLVPAILAAEPIVRREVVRWTRMHGPGGRLILIDTDTVARIAERWMPPI